MSIYGIDSVRVGMTVNEASRAAGVRIAQWSSEPSPGCSYFKPNQPTGLSFMVVEGRIARVDVENRRITTVSGAKVGDKWLTTNDSWLMVYGKKISLSLAISH